MLKKVIMGLTVAGLVTMGSLSAAAGEPGGTVRVNLKWGETPVTGSVVELYRAGEAIPEGYRLTDRFGGGVIRNEDVFSHDLARWMSESAENGFSAQTDEGGKVEFTDLAYGLYLVMQHEDPEDYLPLEPYMVCISPEMALVDTYPEMEKENPRTFDPILPVYAGAAMGSSFLMLVMLLGKRLQKVRCR